MTYKPPGPFDTLIRDLLDNVQRNADATMKRFEAEDAKNFEREMAERQEKFTVDRDLRARKWAVEDRDLARANVLEDYERTRGDFLADDAVRIRMGYQDELLSVLPYLSSDDPDYDRIMEIVRSLGDPITETGEAARQAALNMNIVLSDGTPMSLQSLIAKLTRQRDVVKTRDDWQNSIFQDALNFVGDTGKNVDARAARVTSMRNLEFMTPALYDLLLDTAGVVDPDVRKAVKDGEILRGQDITLGRQAIAMGLINLGKAQVELDEMRELRGMAYKEAQARLREMAQKYRLNEVDAFMTIGLMPDDPDDRAKLATLIPGINGDLDALAELGARNFGRATRVAEAAAQSVELSNMLTGVNITSAQLDAKMKNYEFNRSQMWDAIDDIKEMSAWALAASTLGDIESLELLQSLQGSAGYEALDGLRFDSLISRARAVRADEEDLRAHDKATRDILLSDSAIANAASMDEYISTLASTLLREDFSVNLETGDRDALRGAVESILNRLNKDQLNAIGVSEDEMRERLYREAVRQKLEESRQQDALYLTALESSVPAPTNPGAQATWRNNYLVAAERLGLDVEIMASVADGLLSGADTEFWKAASQTQLNFQQASLAYEQTVGQSLNNLILMGGVGEETRMSVEELAKIIDLFDGGISLSLDMIKSPICSAVGSEEALFTRGGIAYDGENPICELAADRYEFGMKAREILVESALTGADVILPGGRTTADAASTMDSIPFDIVTAGIEAAGGSMEGVDRGRYERLLPNTQSDVAKAVARGEIRSAEDLNAFLAEAEIQDALDSKLVVVPPDLPTMADSGVSVTSDEWMELPAEEKAEALAGTQEWMTAAAEIASSGASLDAMDPDSVSKYAVQFGFMVPPDSSEAQAASEQVKAWYERPETGPGADIGGSLPRAGIGGAIRGALQYGADLIGGLGVAGRAIWNGVEWAWDPSGKAEQSTKLVPDLAGFTEAMTPVVDDLIEDALERLGAQAAAQRAMYGAATAQGETTEAAPQRDMVSEIYGRIGTPATPTGTGRPTDYSGMGQPTGQPSEQPGGGWAPSYDPDRTPTPAGERTPVDSLNIPPGDPNTSFASYYSLAESVMPALVWIESKGKHLNSDGTFYSSSTGARGITQVLDSTARSPGPGITPIRNGSEEEYLRFGRDYLASLIARYDGDVRLGLAAYHGGARHIDTALRNARAAGDAANFLEYLPPVSEMPHREQTRAYVPSVMDIYTGQKQLPASAFASPSGAASIVGRQARPIPVPEFRAEVPTSVPVGAPNVESRVAPIKTEGRF